MEPDDKQNSLRECKPHVPDAFFRTDLAMEPLPVRLCQAKTGKGMVLPKWKETASKQEDMSYLRRVSR